MLFGSVQRQTWALKELNFLKSQLLNAVHTYDLLSAGYSLAVRLVGLDALDSAQLAGSTELDARREGCTAIDDARGARGAFEPAVDVASDPFTVRLPAPNSFVFT